MGCESSSISTFVPLERSTFRYARRASPLFSFFRYRKMKERLGMTEIRKQANRLNFGEIEADAYQDDLGFSMGLMKKGGKGSGGIRAAQVNKATNARMSQKLQRHLAKQQQVTYHSLSQNFPV